MRDGLPPLEALRAFEAGAPHLNFPRAAREVVRTQSGGGKHAAYGRI